MGLLDPFSCQLHHIAFDRLKSHTPLPCPGTQSINILKLKGRFDNNMKSVWKVKINMSFSKTKPTNWHMRPAKTQISQGICPVWSESSLLAWRKLRSLVIHWAQSEDTDQTPRLIGVFAGRIGHFVGFVNLRPIYRLPNDIKEVIGLWD